MHSPKSGLKVLISGAGIAGPTLAYWLLHYGMNPTIVEEAPKLRTGGYLIDFWGTGFDIAEQMGILPAVRRKGYHVQEVRVVDRRGKRVSGFSTKVLDRVLGDRFVSLPRGDLASLIFSQIEGKVETIFGDSVARIQQSETGARVIFESGTERDFDIVIGADGLHSRVREIVFGPENRFERFLGYKVAVFEVEGYRPRDELVYVMYTEVGQQVGRFSMVGNRTMFIFTFADDNAGDDVGDIQRHKALLRKRFGNGGWECPQILELLDQTNELYFDRVSQIRIQGESDSWTSGRVTLLGDAASCVSLLAGQGTALAMVGAFVLASELNRAGGDYSIAFARYQQLFGPFVLKKQNAALRFGGFFAPKSELSLLMRNQLMKLMSIPWVADFAVGRDFTDHIELADYK